VRLCYIKHPWRTKILYATGITGGTGLPQGRQPPEAYKKLYATAMTCIRCVHGCCTPRIGLVGPEGTRTNSIRGVHDLCMPRIWDYPWRTEILYASDAMPRPVQTYPTKALWRACFLYAMAMAAAVVYTFPVRLCYIAVAYRFLRTPLMNIPPMTYFLVVLYMLCLLGFDEY
jgi:hypothetical protein